MTPAENPRSAYAQNHTQVDMRAYRPEYRNPGFAGYYGKIRRYFSEVSGLGSLACRAVFKPQPHDRSVKICGSHMRAQLVQLDGLTFQRRQYRREGFGVRDNDLVQFTSPKAICIFATWLTQSGPLA